MTRTYLPSKPSRISVVQNFKTHTLPKGLCIATTSQQIRKIEHFRKRIFQALYPGMQDFHNDVHDQASLILYTENSQQEITSTVRIVLDSPLALPADEYAASILQMRRQAGIKLAELSRFAIADKARKQGLLPLYYKAVYNLCAENNIDSMIIIIQQKSVAFHKKRIGAHLLMEDIGHHYGRNDLQFACMEWSLADTRPAFFKWIKQNRPGSTPPQGAFPEQDWNNYARVFASVLSPMQREVYLDACRYLHGRVLDLGCGPARLAAYLAEKTEISHYTGIEYAQAMLELGRKTLDQLARPGFSIRQHNIENLQAADFTETFDAIVSLQSYYAWEDPQAVIKQLFPLLRAGGNLILATINPHYDLEKLISESHKDLMWHPDYQAFKAYNRKLANKPQTRYTSMDTLIRQVQAAGFAVRHCHQRHYAGGLNFLVCNKP